MFKTSFLLQPCSGDPFRYAGEQAAQVIREQFPDIVGYIQTRALPGQESASFSGCAELFFHDNSTAMAAGRAGISALINEPVEVQSVLTGMERVVARLPEFAATPKIKGVYPFRRRPDLSLPAFQNHWWRVHGPIAALTEEALAYVQIHPLPEAYEVLSPAYDGITEIYWRDEAAAGRAIESRQMREDQGGDAPNFVDMESIALFLAAEEIVIES